MKNISGVSQPSINPSASVPEAGDPRLATDIENPVKILLDNDATLEAKRAAHIAAQTGIHGATSAATANKIIIRDNSGRAKVAAPAAGDDIARKNEVDAVQTNLNQHTGSGGNAHALATNSQHGFMSAADHKMLDDATPAATVNELIQRDGSGRAKVAAPAAAGDIARKAETDAVQTNLNQHAGSRGNAHALATDTEAGFLSAGHHKTLGEATAAATPNTVIKRDGSGRAKVAAPSASTDIARKAETDAVQTNLNQHVGSGGGAHALATTSSSGFMSAPDKSKLNGVEAGAEANPTSGEIKTAYESNNNTNAFTDAYKGKLDAIQASEILFYNILISGQVVFGPGDSKLLTTKDVSASSVNDVAAYAIPAFSFSSHFFLATALQVIDANTVRVTVIGHLESIAPSGVTVDDDTVNLVVFKKS